MASFPTDATYTNESTTYSMSARKPDRGFNIDNIFNTSIFTSQIGYEKRRQISRRSKRKISLTYTNINGGFKTALENFFKNRGGDAEAFEFNLSYLGLSGTILVRFEGGLQTSETLSSEDPLNSFYNIRFTLQETFS
jgi:hypothetical protein